MNLDKNKFIANMAKQLEKQFKSPFPEITLVAREYLGIHNETTARRYAKECRFPFPCFTLAKKAGYHVNIDDLAALIYERYAEAHQDHSNMQEVYPHDDILKFKKRA